MELKINTLTHTVETLFNLSRKQKWIWLIIGLLGSYICNFLFAPMESILRTMGYGILDFEFAWGASQMNTILTAWQNDISTARTFLFVDMFYPIFYSVFISGWALLLTSKKDTILQYGVVIVFLAAFSDYIENIFSIYILYNTRNYLDLAPFLVSLFASIKFVLLIIAVLINVFTSIRAFINLFKK